MPEIKTENKKIKYSEIFVILRKRPNLIQLILIYDVAFLAAVTTKSPAYIPYFFNILKVTPVTYGIFNGFTTLLLVVVPLIIHRFIKSKRIKEYAYISVVGEGIITLFIAAIPFVFGTYAIFVLFSVIIFAAFFSTLEMDSFLTFFQKAVPKDILGRFYSVRSLLRGAITISAYIVGGYACDLFGPIPVLLVTGISVLIITVPLKRVLRNP